MLMIFLSHYNFTSWESQSKHELFYNFWVLLWEGDKDELVFILQESKITDVSCADTR